MVQKETIVFHLYFGVSFHKWTNLITNIKHCFYHNTNVIFLASFFIMILARVWDESVTETKAIPAPIILTICVKTILNSTKMPHFVTSLVCSYPMVKLEKFPPTPD